MNNTESVTASDLNDYEMDIEQLTEVGFSPDIKTAKVTIEYKVTPVKDGVRNDGLGAEFTIDFFIEIDNYTELVVKKGDELIADSHLLVNLVAVSFSTGRGILYSKLHSTHLEKIILPIIDPINLIKLDETNEESNETKN
ncbi:MAG: hypothetical protein L3J29_02950 [Cyclobacteriaceae bacterium]|nr:hypothetical protein [Cyclobacteriaceae bacterium]